MAPPLPEGAERASRKGIGAPDRQRHGQGIARAFRWREMLENGTYATIAEIAAAERINESYTGRVIRLTLLAPDIVQSIWTRGSWRPLRWQCS
jgi:hypothetical protein